MSILKKGGSVSSKDFIKIDVMPYEELNVINVYGAFAEVGHSFMIHKDCVKPFKRTEMSYQNSNRYKLREAVKKTGYAATRLSLAADQNQYYFGSEMKESRFNSRGDLNETQFNKLLTNLAFAERKLNGVPAKIELEPKENYEHLFYDLTKNIEHAAKCFEDTFNRSIVDHKEDLFMVESDGVKPTFTPKQKIKSKTEVNKSIVWFILFALVVVILMLVAGIYKSIF